MRPNYIKVVVYREPGRRFLPLDAGGVCDVFAGGNQFGENDKCQRVDSYIWPFRTREGAAEAFSAALVVYSEAKALGYTRVRLVVATDDAGNLFGASRSVLGVPVRVVAPTLSGAGTEDYGD